MDLIKKMVEAVEAAITDATDLKVVAYPLTQDTNPVTSLDDGFRVLSTTLEQVEGGVGFLLFRQGFRLELYKKYYKNKAQEAVFNLSSELAKIFNRLYIVRVTGDNYQVLNIDQVVSTEPEVLDNFVKIVIDFSALFRMQNVFRGA